MNTQIITRPRCGHTSLQEGCPPCLSHHLDKLRHAEAMLRKLANERAVAAAKAARVCVTVRR